MRPSRVVRGGMEQKSRGMFTQGGDIWVELRGKNLSRAAKRFIVFRRFIITGLLLLLLGLLFALLLGLQILNIKQSNRLLRSDA